MFPEPISPMLATLITTDQFGAQEGWAFEMKWDGVRTVAYLADGQVKLLSRKGRDDTAAYFEIAEALARLDVRSAILDGEVVVLDASGRPDFGLLQNRINLTRPADIQRLAQTFPAHLMLFDILELNGRSLVQQTYDERRAVLDQLTGLGPRIQLPPIFDGDLQAAQDTSRTLRLEGVVAKRRSSAYEPGRRSTNWRKIKEHPMQAVVIGGWRPGRGRRDGGIGSLLMAVPTEAGLHYVGRVGSGFNDRSLVELQQRLEGLAERECPMIDVPREDARDAHWVRPEVVGEVTYGELTGPGRMRHPVWRGLRPDLHAADVTWELPAG